MSKKKLLSREEIIHLANLANLKLTEEEIKKYQEQLTETLDYVKNLNELQTDDVESTNQSIKLKNVNFEDGEKNKRGLTQSDTLANSKAKKDNYFVVKRIL